MTHSEDRVELTRGVLTILLVCVATAFALHIIARLVAW